MTTTHARSGGGAVVARRRGGVGRWSTLVATLVLAGALAACGASAGADTLDADTLERDIASLLGDEGLDAEVDCPADLAVADGDEFTCTATVAGSEHRIDARRTGDDIEWETAGVVVDRRVVAEVVTTEAAEAGYEVVVDCGEDDEPDVFIAADGHRFFCGTADLASGDASTIEVVIDSSDDRGFTWEGTGEIIGGNGPGGDGPGGEATGEVVLDDDFSDDSSGWNPEGLVDGGAYYVDFADSGFAWNVREPLDLWIEYYPNVLEGPGRRGELDDVRVEATASALDALPAVICRATETDGYIGLVNSIGSARISKWGPDGLERLAGTHVPLGDTDPDEYRDTIAASPAHDWNGIRQVTIALECEDQPNGSVALRFYVDGELLLAHVDDEPTSGGTPSIMMFPAGITEDDVVYPYTLIWKRFTVSTL